MTFEGAVENWPFEETSHREARSLISPLRPPVSQLTVLLHFRTSSLTNIVKGCDLNITRRDGEQILCRLVFLRSSTQTVTFAVGHKYLCSFLKAAALFVKSSLKNELQYKIDFKLVIYVMLFHKK